MKMLWQRLPKMDSRHFGPGGGPYKLSGRFYQLDCKWMVPVLAVGLSACGGAATDIAQSTPELAGMVDASVLAASGSGEYPAIMYEDTGLPDHTVYRPADLAQVADAMPLYIWGNGGCSADGASARNHLLEIASHGYLVVASGRIRSGPTVEEPADFSELANGTSPEQMLEAIDWALSENRREGGDLFGKLAVEAIAVSGHSCGGLQAILNADDRRVDTAVVMNSGIYNDEGPGRSGMVIKKTQLQEISVPMLYVLGGPEDIAYPNGMDDYGRIETNGVAVVNLPVGHGGTFGEKNGGEAAEVVVAWLDWVLKGDGDAGQMFVGASCELCTRSDIEYQSKNLEADWKVTPER